MQPEGVVKVCRNGQRQRLDERGLWVSMVEAHRGMDWGGSVAMHETGKHRNLCTETIDLAFIYIFLFILKDRVLLVNPG